MMSVWVLEGIGEITTGDDLGAIISSVGSSIADGDILAVTSKIVSKAEGRFVVADDREQAITEQTVRLVAQRGQTRIVENHLGIVAAAAGIDASNTPTGTILLLPIDPDASAAGIRSALHESLGVSVGVVITDTLGRPWREGQTDVAIGASGVRVLDDLRGSTDANGVPLLVTAPAVGDEIAAAADLVKGKATANPVAVIRGLAHLLDDSAPGARSLVRSPQTDMFRLGSDEAYTQGFAAGKAENE